MKTLTVVFGLMALVTATPIAHAEDAPRFAPLKMNELTPQQKALAESLAAPNSPSG